VFTPTAESFAALARSSPWRWSTLRFTVSWSGGPTGQGAVRAWLRRPGLLRVETLDGALIQVVREPGPAVGVDAPMFQNYHWVAMLNPVELADGIDRETGEPVPALAVEDVTIVEHGGRPAWEAVVRTTPAYEPRCGCCPLLRSREVDLVEYEDYPHHILAAYPEAHRVRLDAGTGVCVFSEEIGGLAPGPRHGVWIEAVDEPMDDALFIEPRRVSFRRRGWSPLQ
jgi:hypothetical protein